MVNTEDQLVLESEPLGELRTDPLEEATRLLAQRELELESKGYAPGLVRAALARARGIAEYRTQVISPSIRDQAFLDVLKSELTTAETWIIQELHFLNAPDNAESEEKGGE